MQDSKYIRDLVKLIPAKFYASVQPEQPAEHWKKKKDASSQKPRSKQAAKQASREKQEKSRQAKLSRLDPKQLSTSAEDLKLQSEAKAAANMTSAGASPAPSVVFNKLDFENKGAKKKKGKTDYKKLLVRAEQRQEKLKQLKSTDSDLADQKEASTNWNRALKKTEGAKLKDDPQLLRKTVKRQEQIKKQSKKKWNERLSTQKKRQGETQDKRQANLRKRIADKKEKKKAKRDKRR